jgi:hypothetical protein
MTEKSVFRVFARIIGLMLVAFAIGEALAGERSALGYGATGLALILGAEAITGLFYRDSYRDAYGGYAAGEAGYRTDRGEAGEAVPRVPPRRRDVGADAA